MRNFLFETAATMTSTSTRLPRRAFLLAALPLLAAQTPARRDPSDGNVLRHQGFAINMQAIANLPNHAAIVTAMQRQIEITAGCGAKADIMAMFRKQPIAVVRSTGKGGGLYSPDRGIEVDVVPLPPPNNPVLLHELIHAMHHVYLPRGNANPDVERFYQIARKNRLYPNADYMMSNNREFFAVTASLYLWGAVARPPYTREPLRTRQPLYYSWLGELFGVKK